MLLEISWTIEFFPLARPRESPGLPPPGFSFRKAALCRRQAPVEQRPYARLMRPRPRGARRRSGPRADRPRCGRRASPPAPPRRGARACAPFAGFRPDHHAGIELAAVDAHRAAETAADLEGGFDDRVAREARRDRSEIGDFPGRGRASPPAPPRRGAVYRAAGVI